MWRLWGLCVLAALAVYVTDAAPKPKYLNVPNFTLCLAVKERDSWSEWCLPTVRPEKCPAPSWQALTDGDPTDAVPDCNDVQEESLGRESPSRAWTWMAALLVSLTLALLWMVRSTAGAAGVAAHAVLLL